MAGSDHDAQVLDTVDTFFAALGAGDIDACYPLFADDAVVWHNYDNVEMSYRDALAQLAGLGSMNARFEIVRRYVVPDGCVQQHVVRRDADGKTLELHAVQRIVCAGGKITRIDEYMDTAQMGAFAGMA